jgi:hypothetical protein
LGCPESDAKAFILNRLAQTLRCLLLPYESGSTTYCS